MARRRRRAKDGHGPAPTEPVSIVSTSQDPAHQQKEEICHLMRLPAELRNSIYELVVVRPFAITIGSNMGSSKELSKAGQLPAITRTNRQIRNEALSIFLAANTFDVYFHYDYRRIDRGDYNRSDIRPALSGAHLWLSRMTLDQRRQIKEILLCTPLNFKALFTMLTPYLEYPSSIEEWRLCGGQRLHIKNERVGDKSCAANVLCGENLNHFRIRVQERGQGYFSIAGLSGSGSDVLW
ncbi:hypothetical protein LTR56_000948 [Elasticomyces elasticus]|nr:hypothetical protein LTR56_000948 [Elasticomyces elasticus]KAK3665522.1 hypothetical protein LTR22_003752 [Elasticomyces elasticus]KAK4929835.1 hypothetical protein LTR49_003462 [Elasticomyces elasticus]KAK5759464.1 hypothetical protein LTS12_010477 [Elasticomyces elasticus]